MDPGRFLIVSEFPDKLVEWQIENGSNGLVPDGTTGESPTLSHDEHKRVVEIVTVDRARPSDRAGSTGRDRGVAVSGAVAPGLLDAGGIATGIERML